MVAAELSSVPPRAVASPNATKHLPTHQFTSTTQSFRKERGKKRRKLTSTSILTTRSIAHYLNGNLKFALKVLDEWEKNLDPRRPDPAYERSEIVMYNALLLEEMGEPERVLELLNARCADVVDRSAWMEKKGAILLALGQFDQAKRMFRSLLRRNPECYDYHRGLQVRLRCGSVIGKMKREVFTRIPCHDLLVSYVPDELPRMTRRRRFWGREALPGHGLSDSVRGPGSRRHFSFTARGLVRFQGD